MRRRRLYVRSQENDAVFDFGFFSVFCSVRRRRRFSMNVYIYTVCLFISLFPILACSFVNFDITFWAGRIVRQSRRRRPTTLPVFSVLAVDLAGIASISPRHCHRPNRDSFASSLRGCDQITGPNWPAKVVGRPWYRTFSFAHLYAYRFAKRPAQWISMEA